MQCLDIRVVVRGKLENGLGHFFLFTRGFFLERTIRTRVGSARFLAQDTQGKTGQQSFVRHPKTKVDARKLPCHA